MILLCREMIAPRAASGGPPEYGRQAWMTTTFVPTFARS